MKSVLLLVAMVILPSCVSTRKYKSDLETVANVAKNAIAVVKAECAAESIEKDARLRQFNQLNADGTLR